MEFAIGAQVKMKHMDYIEYAGKHWDRSHLPHPQARVRPEYAGMSMDEIHAAGLSFADVKVQHKFDTATYTGTVIKLTKLGARVEFDDLPIRRRVLYVPLEILSIA